MRLDRFDLNLLVVLDALLDERNVTRASERLHIGQSATSGALGRLREYFGDELLQPVGRRMVLTPLGQSLVAPVRETLDRARLVMSLQPGFDPTATHRRFSVRASDYVTTVLLADVVTRLAVVAPGIAIDIRSPPRDVAEVMGRGEVDLLILPEQYLASLTLPQARLFEDDQVCMVWSGNRQVGESIDFAHYLALGHLAVRHGDERQVSAFEDWFLPRFGQQRRVEASVDNFSTVPLLLIGTDRVATLASRLAAYFVRHLPLRVLPAPFEMPTLVEVMVWPRHLDADPAHRWLRETLASSAAAMPPLIGAGG